MDRNKKFENSLSIVFNSQTNYFSLDPGGNHDLKNIYIPIFINTVKVYQLIYNKYNFLLNSDERYILWNRYFPNFLQNNVTTEEFLVAPERPLTISDFIVIGNFTTSYNDKNFMLSYENLLTNYAQSEIESAIQSFIDSTENKSTQLERYNLWNTITPNLTIPNYTIFQNIPEFTFQIPNYIKNIHQWNQNYNDKILFNSLPDTSSFTYLENSSQIKRYQNLLNIYPNLVKLIFINLNQVEFITELTNPSSFDFQLTNTNWNDIDLFNLQPSDHDIQQYLLIRNNSDNKIQRYIKWITIHAGIMNYPTEIIIDKEFTNEPTNSVTVDNIVNMSWNSNYNDHHMFNRMPTTSEMDNYIAIWSNTSINSNARWIKWYNINNTLVKEIFPINASEFNIEPTTIETTSFVTIDGEFNTNYLDIDFFQVGFIPNNIQLQNYINIRNINDTKNQRFVKWYNLLNGQFIEGYQNMEEFIVLPTVPVKSDFVFISGWNSNYLDQSLFSSIPELDYIENYIVQRNSIDSNVERYNKWISIGATLMLPTQTNLEFIITPNPVINSSYILEWQWESNYLDQDIFINNLNGNINLLDIENYLTQYISNTLPKGTKQNRYDIWNIINSSLLTNIVPAETNEFMLIVSNYITFSEYNANYLDGGTMILPLHELYNSYNNEEIETIFQSYINYRQQVQNKKYNTALTNFKNSLTRDRFDVNVIIEKDFDVTSINFKNLIISSILEVKELNLNQIKTDLAGFTQGSQISNFSNIMNYLNQFYINFVDLMTGNNLTNYIIYFLEFPYPIDFKSYSVNINENPILITDIIPNIQKEGGILENINYDQIFLRNINDYFDNNNFYLLNIPRPSSGYEYSLVYNYSEEQISGNNFGGEFDENNIFQKNTSEIIIPTTYFRRLAEIPYINPTYLSCVAISIPHFNMKNMGKITFSMEGISPITLNLNWINANNEEFLTYLKTKINDQIKSQGNVDNTINIYIDTTINKVVIESTSLSNPTNPPAFQIVSSTGEFEKFVGMNTISGSNLSLSVKSFFQRDDFYNLTCNYTRGKTIFASSINKTYTGTNGNEYIDSSYYGIVKHIQINQEIGYMIDNDYGRNVDLIPITHADSKYLIFSLRDITGELIKLNNDYFNVVIEFYW